MEVVHFGQWILHRPILGSGFHIDPFWAVDSNQTHFGQWILHRPILGSGFPTVWKFYDLSLTQILREKKNQFGDCRNVKSAIFTLFDALLLDFYEFLPFLDVELPN